MGTAEILTSLIKTFIIIIPGYVLTRMGIMKKDHTESISSLITCVTYPCLVIDAMQTEFSAETMNNCKYLVLIFLCLIVLLLILSRLVTGLVNLPASKSGIFSFMLIFGNTGFIGVPVLGGLFGAEALLYGSLCDSLFDIFMFTIGVTLIRQAAADGRKASVKETLKSVFNPCLIGVIIGLTFYITGFTLPEIIGDPVSTIGSLTSPLAMIVVGAHLASIRFRELFSDAYSYLVGLMKLIITPLIALLLVKLTIGTGSVLSEVIVIQAAMPVAMCSVIFSEEYHADASFAARGTLLTTLCCIITVPLFALLLQYV